MPLMDRPNPAMQYSVFGPYRLARDGALVSRSAEDRRGLWHMMEADAPGQNVHGAGGFLFPVNANSTVAVASLFTRTVCLSTPDRSCQVFHTAREKKMTVNRARA